MNVRSLRNQAVKAIKQFTPDRAWVVLSAHHSKADKVMAKAVKENPQDNIVLVRTWANQ